MFGSHFKYSYLVRAISLAVVRTNEPARCTIREICTAKRWEFVILLVPLQCLRAVGADVTRKRAENMFERVGTPFATRPSIHNAFDLAS